MPTFVLRLKATEHMDYDWIDLLSQVLHAKKNCCSQMSYAPSSGEEESNDEFGERGGGGRPNNQGCKCNRVSLDKSTVGGMTGIQYFSRNI